MSVSRLNENQLRPAEHLLLWAFALSIAAHLIIYGGFEAGQRFGWWRKDLMPNWLKRAEISLADLQKARLQQPQQPAVPREAPLLFVEVDPSQSVPEPPKDAKYYSSKNSLAANPDLTVDTQTPKIDGSQTQVPKTQTAPRSKPTPAPLQPSPPKNQEPQQANEESKPKPKGGQQVGDLAMAKPSPQPGPGDGQSENDTGQSVTPVHTRPRTLRDAEAQNFIPGEKMKQDGGVKRVRVDSSLNAIATPFGEYDRELIAAIQSRWYDLLEQKGYAFNNTGRVVIVFRLNYDGRVSDVSVVESTVGDLLADVCQLAITDPAPYAKWSTEMRQFFGANYREVRFTFYYY